MGTSQHGVDVNAQPEVLIISESKCRRQNSYHIMASVLVRSRRFWNNSPERANTNTATVQNAPRDVGPSAIGRRAKVCKVLG